VTEHRLDVHGLTFRVLDEGAGPAVVLLHGFPDSADMWRHQIAALAAAGNRVIAPDLRGFGASSRPPAAADYGMRLLIGDVLGILDALGVDAVDVAGHDWGAALAWHVAFAAPERVRRLAVVSVGHPAAGREAGIPQRRLSWYMLWFLFPGVAEEVMPAEDWRFFREWAWDGAARGSDPHLDRQLADLARPGALTAGLNWYRANIDPVAFARPGAGRAASRRLACPVLGVWSSADFALGEAQLAGSERYVDGPWRYERIEGVGHWVPVHAAERLSEVLVDFLDG